MVKPMATTIRLVTFKAKEHHWTRAMAEKNMHLQTLVSKFLIKEMKLSLRGHIFRRKGTSTKRITMDWTIATMPKAMTALTWNRLAMPRAMHSMMLM